MTSPYLTSQEAADFLRYKTVNGFLQAVRKRAIPNLIRGKALLFLQDDLVKSWARPVKANLREAKRRCG